MESQLAFIDCSLFVGSSGSLWNHCVLMIDSSGVLLSVNRCRRGSVPGQASCKGCRVNKQRSRMEGAWTLASSGKPACMDLRGDWLSRSSHHSAVFLLLHRCSRCLGNVLQGEWPAFIKVENSNLKSEWRWREFRQKLSSYLCNTTGFIAG